MDSALAYLIRRFFWRVADFFHHWYVDGFRNFLRAFMSFLENLDKTFALVITIKLFFRPLWGDYSIIGRFLGIIFRSIRIVIGGVVYLFIFIVFLAAFLVWSAMPLAFLFMALKSFSK